MGGREGQGTQGLDRLGGHKDSGAPDGRTHCLSGGMNTLVWLQVMLPALAQTLICNIG